MNVRILTEDLAQESTMDSSPPANASLPLTNLEDSRREYVARLDNASGSFDFYFANSPVNCVFVAGHNQVAGALCQIQLFTSGDTVQVYTSGTKAMKEGQVWSDCFTTVNAETLRVTIVGSDPIDVGYVLFGEGWEPTYNPEYGMNLTQIDEGRILRTAGGSSIVIPGAIYRRLEIQFGCLDKTDRNDLFAALKNAGKSGIVGVSIYPDDDTDLQEDHAFVARISENYSTRHNYYGNWEGSLVLEEI